DPHPATAGGRQAALRHAADRVETALAGLEGPLDRYLLELEADAAEGRSWYGGPGAAELVDWGPVLARAGGGGAREGGGQGRVGANALVGGDLELDLLGAGHPAALADDRHRVRQRPEDPVQALDLLVHGAVEDLVLADAPRPVVERRGLPRIGRPGDLRRLAQ